MFKNLNDLSATNINMNYNNSLQLSTINSQLNTAVTFVKQDIQYDYVNQKKYLIIEGRILKNCVIKCPNGQILTGLDYKIHYRQNENDLDKTIFNFSYIEQNQWQEGTYFIYSGMPDKGVGLHNAQSQSGIKLLNIDGEDYSIKKLIAGNGIIFRFNKQQLMIQLGQSTYYSQPKNLNDPNNFGIIDRYNGDFQVFYALQNAEIKELKDTFIEENQILDDNNSSYLDYSISSYSVNNGSNILYVNILFYKPYQTLLTYRNNVVLNKYDIGWFSFHIKKIFGSLFIGQPTRIITDYKLFD